MVKVYAPNSSFNGISAGVAFADGVGETSNEAAIAWLQRSGYGIGSPHPAYAQRADPYQQSTPTVVRGTESRDASVEKDAGGPVSDAFLPPTNAGEADPNGPLVVAPGIHASGQTFVRPGPVAVDAPAEQEQDETAHAAYVYGVGIDRSAVVGGDQATEAADDGGAPAASATKAEWVDYAVARGADRDEAEDLTKAELRERYA